MEKLLINSNYKILDFKYEQDNLYNIIFKFCKENKVIIYNKNVNISFLNNIPYNLKDLDNDFSFILFSQSPKKHSLELINILYNNYSKYVFYTSYIEDKEIIISIDNNRVIYFNLLFSPNINFFDIFNVIKYDKFNKSPIYILPNIIILLFLTRDLYKPANLLKLIDNGNIMTNHFILNNELSSKFDHLNTYSMLLKTVFTQDLKKTNQEITTTYVNNTKSIILSNFIKTISKFDLSKNIILLDNCAIDILLDKEINYNETINMVIKNNSNSNKFNVIQYILDILKDILKENHIKYKKLLYNKSNLFLYNDFRLKKTNIFILTDDNKKISLMNIFNSSDYELIPIVKKYKNFLIPHEFVIIRFMILNLVSMQLYDPYFTTTGNGNKNIYSKYGSYIWSLCNSDIKHNKIYYTGVYRDDKMDRFKLGSYVYRPLQIAQKKQN
jgi:hypothetical protein